jgi:hypothetical protein
MNVEIKKWGDIDGDDGSSLLVGNGGSIAIDSRFAYPSLHEVARKRDLLRENGKAVFDQYGSTNFEFILETLSHALRVEKALALDPSKVAATHDEVQRALIETVKATHCGPDQVRVHLGQLTRFLTRFETVVTFNYDLTLYWAMIEANATVLNCNWFKDGFVDKGSS